MGRSLVAVNSAIGMFTKPKLIIPSQIALIPLPRFSLKPTARSGNGATCPKIDREVWGFCLKFLKSTENAIAGVAFWCVRPCFDCNTLGSELDVTNRGWLQISNKCFC
jgi:hypothetical protein